MAVAFDVAKRNVLGKLDKSPKGSIDAPILDLIHAINGHPDYVTTSSCSGRIAVYASAEDGERAHRASVRGRWLLVEHRPVEPSELMAVLSREALAAHAQAGLTRAVLKAEPAIVHVQCRDIPAARLMMQVATGCGFRESGISVGSRAKVMLAIRTTSNSMEVPLVRRGECHVGGVFLEELVEGANERLAANFAALGRLRAELKSRLLQQEDHSLAWEEAEHLPTTPAVR